MTTFELCLFIAASAYVGPLFSYITIQYINNGFPLSNYYKDSRLYHLSFVYKRAQELLNQGLSDEEVLRILRSTRFGFQKVEWKKDKDKKAVAFVEAVLADDELLKLYLFPYGFDKHQFSKLCEAKSKGDLYMKANQAMQALLQKDSPEYLSTMLDVVVQLFSKDNNMRERAELKKKGDNELYVYLGMQKAGLLKPDLKYGKFIEQVKIISMYYRQMDVLAPGGNSTYGLDKKSNTQLIDLYSKEIVNLANKISK